MKLTKKKVKCTHAASDFYSAGKLYDVYLSEDKQRHVKGKDGLFDRMTLMSSKFVEVANEEA